MPAGSGGRGNAETLRRYWTEGEGAAKIRWGEGGDFNRCVEHLSKYVSGAKGMCNLLHKRALGYYPATHAKMSHDVNLLEASVELGIAQPAVLALGSWNSMLHPRTPAGQAGGGKFTSGSGGGKGKGGGKGAKGAAAAAKAAKAAQAQQVYANFLKMNPQQRSAFLAKLTDPQLKALLHEASLGNSNDPATRAALTAIKDQMAARSLTGAKGPTAINAGKAAAAAKSAAGKQAAAAKKASTAQASAAKKQATAQNTAARKQLAAAKAAATAQAKAQKSAVANQAASLKALSAMNAPTQKAQVAGLTSALKATSNPAQQQQILAQLKKALGLAQTAGVAEVLALAGSHHYRHGWIRLDELPDYETGRDTRGGGPHVAPPKAATSAKSERPRTPDKATAAPKATPSKTTPSGTTPAQYAARSKPPGVAGKAALIAGTSGDGSIRADANTLADLKARGYVEGSGRAATLTPAGKAAGEALKARKPIPDTREPVAIRNARSAAARNGGDAAAVAALGGPAQARKLRAMNEADVPAPLRKAWRRLDGMTDAEFNKALGLSHVALAYMPNTSSGDGAAITVNANLRQKYAKTGVALKDGSFPIPDHAHLRKALKAVGRAHPSKRPAVRAHIRKRAKALGVDLRDSSVGNGG